MNSLLRLFLTALLFCGAAPCAFANVPNVTGSTAAYGGKFEDVLRRSLVSEASAASFEFIGHKLKQADNRKLSLPEATVLHAMVGGALAQVSGGDFTTGAIATATAHVVAEQVKSHYLDQVISDEGVRDESLAAEYFRQFGGKEGCR
ncbi:MAG: DUF637 domain-containing protein [Mariprofundaceae bacterium]|nr:DUF637 domain-containing protein [Mariprofundaceae bacterium]